jgi:ribosome biogenesis protein SSF1/2
MLSESEFEDDPSNQVTLPQKIISRGNVESGKSAIKLHELGPRLTLQLIKIEDGLLDGEVLYHNLIEKTDEEKLEIQKKRENKKKLKEKRKKIQAKNKEVKENLKQKLKEKSLEGMKKVNPQEKSSSEANEAKEPEDNDADYYREEVGEEPDEDLFSSSTANAKRPPKFVQFRRKRKWDDTNKSPVKRFKTDGVKYKNTNRKRK